MIDRSEKCNCKLGFKVHSLHVIERHSKMWEAHPNQQHDEDDDDNDDNNDDDDVAPCPPPPTIDETPLCFDLGNPPALVC